MSGSSTHAANAVRELEARQSSDSDPDAVATSAARIPAVSAIRVSSPYRSDSDPVLKMLAEDTMKLREQRCGSKLARTPRERDAMKLLADEARKR